MGNARSLEVECDKQTAGKLLLDMMYLDINKTAQDGFGQFTLLCEESKNRIARTAMFKVAQEKMI